MALENRHDTIQPHGWPRPKGYSNGVLASPGQLLFVAGQVGWNEREEIVSTDFLAQFDRALANVLAVVNAAGGRSDDICRMTIFVADKAAYEHARTKVGAAYRAQMGHHYPAMTLVEVKALLEEGALVEIEATAVIPNKRY